MKRPGTAYDHMAPPPKIRPGGGLIGPRDVGGIVEEKENSMERQLREGSDAAWSTEQEEVY